MSVLQGIEAFVAVADAGSFRGGAARLGVTPAATSKAVKRLEAELGVPLFHRTTRRVELSEEGLLFVERCRTALSQLEAGRDAIDRARQVAEGQLTVSMPLLLAKQVVERLEPFQQRYPHLRLRFLFADRFSRLVDEGVDVALRIGELEDSGVRARKLTTTRWVTVASPAYLARRGRPQTPGDLAEHQCLKFVSPAGTHIPWSFLTTPNGTEVSQPEVGGLVEADSGVALIDAAIAGLGLVHGPSIVFGRYLTRGVLLEVLHHHSAPGPPVTALFLPEQQDHPRVRAILEFFVEMFDRR